MRRLLQPRLHSLCFGLALATAASHAYAQSDPGAARSLFDEGRKLLAEGKYSAACPKLEESQKLDPGMGTLFNLADCWEHIGRTASAWARFREVADAASRAGQHDREKIARARVAALDAKLSRLVVEVRASDQGLELKKDGVPFGAAQWGSALPTDAGIHVIEARAPSKQPWKTSIEVTGNGKTVTVVVPPLENEHLSAAAAGTVSAGGATPAGTKPLAAQSSGDANRSEPPPEGTESALHGSGRASGATVTGWILEGAGVLGLAVATGFLFQERAKNEEADTICPTGVNCTQDESSRYSTAIADAKRAQTLSIVGFAAGGAAIAAGTILLLATPKSSASGLRFLPTLGMGTAGAALGGSW